MMSSDLHQTSLIPLLRVDLYQNINQILSAVIKNCDQQRSDRRRAHNCDQLFDHGIAAGPDDRSRVRDSNHCAADRSY